MLRQLIIETIYLWRGMMEKYRSKETDLNTVFIDLNFFFMIDYHEKWYGRPWKRKVFVLHILELYKYV